jgi:2-keto-3-deoxy-L-rhamnonate aldolase RhmA
MATGLKARMQAGEALTGTFVKTPAWEVMEVLAMSGLDVLCLDAEHAPFDRARMDACLAMGRALGIATLVRVPAARPETILAALDSGATGIVVPHVDSLAKAESAARAARFGPGGRGYAGSTRWAGFSGARMPDLLARSAEETVVIVQIEDPAGVEAAAEIAALPGVDGLFVGPADLTVAYGRTDPSAPEVAAAYDRVGRACAAAGTCFATWAPDAATARARRALGVTMVLVGSELGFMLAGARAVAAAAG